MYIYFQNLWLFGGLIQVNLKDRANSETEAACILLGKTT